MHHEFTVSEIEFIDQYHDGDSDIPYDEIARMVNDVFHNGDSVVNLSDVNWALTKINNPCEK